MNSVVPDHVVHIFGVRPGALGDNLGEEHLVAWLRTLAAELARLVATIH